MKHIHFTSPAIQPSKIIDYLYPLGVALVLFLALTVAGIIITMWLNGNIVKYYHDIYDKLNTQTNAKCTIGTENNSDKAIQPLYPAL